MAVKNEIVVKLEELLEKAIAADEAAMGNIQLYRPGPDDLVIVAQKGFNKAFLEHFRHVKAFDSSACGRALAVGSPVVINDVNIDTAFRAHRAVAASAGFRAVKSVPVLSADKKSLGVISTHFTQPRWHWDLTRLNGLLPDLAGLLETLSSLQFAGD